MIELHPTATRTKGQNEKGRRIEPAAFRCGVFA